MRKYALQLMGRRAHAGVNTLKRTPALIECGMAELGGGGAVVVNSMRGN